MGRIVASTVRHVDGFWGAQRLTVGKLREIVDECAAAGLDDDTTVTPDFSPYHSEQRTLLGLRVAVRQDLFEIPSVVADALPTSAAGPGLDVVASEAPDTWTDDPEVFTCGIGQCAEGFATVQKRGAHRRHAHPGWNAPFVLNGEGTEAISRNVLDQVELPRPALKPESFSIGEQGPEPIERCSVCGELTAVGHVHREPSADPPPVAASVVLCECGHGERMHERDSAAEHDRGVCFRRECGCTAYRPAGGG